MRAISDSLERLGHADDDLRIDLAGVWDHCLQEEMRARRNGKEDAAMLYHAAARLAERAHRTLGGAYLVDSGIDPDGGTSKPEDVLGKARVI